MRQFDSLAKMLLLLLCAFLFCWESALGDQRVDDGQDSEQQLVDSSARPNFIFISIDDLNDWVEGFGGHPQTQTPNISELAAKGVSFQNAHAPVAICQPVRVSILSGLSPHRTKIYRPNGKSFRANVGNDVTTVFEYFHEAGYYLAATGKLFHWPWIDSEKWDEREVERSYYRQKFSKGAAKRGEPPFHGLPELLAAMDRNFLWGPISGEGHEWNDYKVASFGRNFLSREHNKPFILALGFGQPHLPWFVPQSYWEKFPEEPELPPYRPDDLQDIGLRAKFFNQKEAHRIIVEGDKWHEAVRAYLASVNYLDDQIGRVMDALKESKYANNTVVIFWSDHGLSLGEKDEWGKATFWEESTRVPLIIVAPGLTPENTNSYKPVSLLDLYPTMVGLIGAPIPESLDGHSLVDLLRDPVNGSRDRDYALTSSHRGDSIRTERWRYIKYRWPYFFGHFGAGEELYDHNNDPNEHHNLAGLPEYSKIQAKLRSKLEIAVEEVSVD